MNKHSQRRSIPIITRNNGQTQQDELFSDFAKNLDKNAVQPRSKDENLYDTMYSIINGKKPRYPSVDAAVRDMLDRTGITSYNKQLQATTQEKTKTASLKVELFDKVPQIKQTIDNHIQSTRGNLLVPEILDRIRAIHKNDVPDDAEWGSPMLLTYINEKNIEEKKQHPDATGLDYDLGKVNYNDDDIDPSNTDALHVLNPAVIK